MPRKITDKTGMRYGHLLAIAPWEDRRNNNGHSLWLCRCDCGRYHVVSTNNLREGGTSTCGCCTEEERMKNTIQQMPWWERRKLLTEKDWAAIERAKRTPWEDIDENWAETEAGKREVHNIAIRKYHRSEVSSGMI